MAMASSKELCFGAPAVLFGTQLVYLFYNLWLHPLRKYPGPWYWAASDLPRLVLVVRGRYVHYNHELHLKYGEVVRVGPNELSYINAQAWKDIYYHGKQGFVKDPDFMGELPNGVVHIGTADNLTHSRMRKAFSHAFSDRALREQEHIIRRYADRMVSMIKGSIATGSKSVKHNMVEVYNFTAFDMMSEMTFGESLHLLEGGKYLPWVTAIFQGLKFMTVRGVMKKLSMIGRLSEQLVSKSLRRQFEAHFNFSTELVNQRLAWTDNTNPDIWHFVLQQKEEVRLSIPEMHSNASGLMVGGAETVATTLGGLTYFLLREPVVLKRLVAEIRGTFKTDEEITLLNVARLEYLGACISESMRLYPSAAVGLPRIVPPEGGTVCNDIIPGKTIVYLSNYAANRSPTNFSRPEEYRPERWLGSDKSFENDRKDVFQPFSVGPRNCIGKNLAWHQMRFIMAKLLWHFDITNCDENESWTDQNVFITWDKKPLACLVSARDLK